MRQYFPNLARPKKAAKHLAGKLHLPLATCQRGIAVTCGYRDWHELEALHASAPATVLDQHLSQHDFVQRQVGLALRLSVALSVPDGDSQFELADSRLTGDRPVSLNDQLHIRLACWRAGDVPLSGRRQRGSVGKIKSPGRNGEVAILRSFGKPTVTLNDYGILDVADFEFIAPRQPLQLFVPIRLYLPYGYWVEDNGAIVLFSRDYKPIWRVRPGSAAERIEPWLWISWRDQHFLWDDARTPWRDRGLRSFLENYLFELGIQTLPIMADALPLLLKDDEARNFAYGAELLQRQRVGDASVAAE